MITTVLCALTEWKRQFLTSGVLVQITAYENKEVYTKGNLKIHNGIVQVYDKSRKTDGLQEVDIGYAFLKKEVVAAIPMKMLISNRKYTQNLLKKGN